MKLKVMTLGLLVSAALTLMLMSRQSQATCLLPACSLLREYYADDTFDQEIGVWNITCHYTSQSGVRSNYYDHTEFGECGNGYGGCAGVDYRCSNGIIIGSNSLAYIGQPCTRYVQ